MDMNSAAADAARITMFESGWFGQGESFWLWIKTPEAEPYIAAFVAQRTRPGPEHSFDLLGDDDTPQGILDITDFDQLTADIRARYGNGDEEDADLPGDDGCVSKDPLDFTDFEQLAAELDAQAEHDKKRQ